MSKPATTNGAPPPWADDPLAYFDANHGDETAQRATLVELLDERDRLQQRSDTLQTECGILSRKIGEARKKRQPADALLTDMRRLSAERKQLKKTLRENRQALQAFFDRWQDAPPTTDTTHDPDASAPRWRQQATTQTPRIDLFHLHVDETLRDNAWNRFVDRHPCGHIHHRLEWQHIYRRAFGHNSLYLCARLPGERIVGILPLLHISSRLFGNMLVSMPFFQRGGALAESAEIERQLIAAAADFGRKMGVDHIEMRDDFLREYPDLPLALQTHKVNMVLPLPADSETLWQGFPAKLRSQIRRAERESPETRFGRLELLDDFYRVYSRNMRDLGSPVQGKQLIRQILRDFPDNSWLVVVRHHNRAVAAGLLLGMAGTLEIPLASTIREANRFSMNMHLYWQILRFACQRGFTRFDFGRSSIDAGTYRFKQQWGARPAPLYWHYWLGEASAPPSLNPSNPKYALVIRLWKRLPVPLTRLIGPPLVKNIP